MKQRTTNKKRARPVRRKTVKNLGAPEAQSVKGGLASRQLNAAAALSSAGSVKP